MLRFTDDEQSLSSVSNGTEAAEMLLERVVKLMNSMAGLATSGSPRSTILLYATGEAGFGEQGVSTVYGMVQCKLDLTGPQCKSCLDGIIGQMRKLFSNDSSQGQPSSFLIGGRLIGVRCNLRYEKELFFEETNDTIKIDMPKSTCCFTAYNLH
uniref:Gnk2-homologous domain-containing protein n=1 Tax=Triticum urartu TaxID=4572 RepID=A0A8R7UVE5_TRIUA